MVRIAEQANECGDLFHRVVDLAAPGAVARDQGLIAIVEPLRRERCAGVGDRMPFHDLPDHGMDSRLDRHDVGVHVVETRQHQQTVALECRDLGFGQ